VLAVQFVFLDDFAVALETSCDTSVTDSILSDLEAKGDRPPRAPRLVEHHYATQHVPMRRGVCGVYVRGEQGLKIK
jgi:hypothetical protein